MPVRFENGVLQNFVKGDNGNVPELRLAITEVGNTYRIGPDDGANFVGLEPDETRAFDAGENQYVVQFSNRFVLLHL